MKIAIGYELEIDNLDSQNAVNLIVEKDIGIINFLYFSSYTRLDRHHEYKNALKLSDVLLSDGIGMQILVYALQHEKIFNNNGTDLIPKILLSCKRQRRPIYFYGASRSVNEKCIGKARLCGYDANGTDGYQVLDLSKVARHSVLLVALGTPKQEIWIQNNRNELLSKELLAISVGGFFDFYVGAVKRAPLIMRWARLEYLYRFLQSPSKHYTKFFRNFLILSKVIKLKNLKNAQRLPSQEPDDEDKS